MRIYLFISFLLLSLTLQAQSIPLLKKKSKDTLTLRLDSSKTTVKHFDGQALERYKAEKDFQYGDVEEKKLSWWKRFWKNFWAWLDRLFGEDEPSAKPSLWPKLFKYATIVISIVAIIFIIFKLLGVDWKIFSSKSKDIEVPYDETLENIHEISFEDELAAALLQQNFRVAVRLLYLKTLKKLDDGGLIDWQLNKTNSAYVTEVKQAGSGDGFAQLTLQFEYVWYGDFDVNKDAYEAIEQNFEQFNRNIK